MDYKVSLHSRKGLSWFGSQRVTNKLGLSNPFRQCNLNLYYTSIVFNFLRKWLRTEDKVMEFVKENIKVLMEIVCYRGVRHGECLPVRGQRSRSNANTQRRKKVIKVIRDDSARRPESKKTKKKGKK